MPSMGYLLKPKKKGDVITARVRLRKGESARGISTGSRVKTDANRFLSRIEILIERRAQGDPPPAELKAWIQALPESTATTLSKWGLIRRDVRGGGRPLLATPDPEGGEDKPGHIDDWQAAVKARSGNTAAHAAKYAGRVRKIAGWLNWETYDEGREDVDEDDARVTASKVEVQLERQGFAPATRAGYLLALEDFCDWMVTEKRARTRLIKAVKKPKPVAGWERRPLEPDEFLQLKDFLWDLGRYPNQHGTNLWTGRDRALIYWTAVKTGYRLGELGSLNVYSLFRMDGRTRLSLPGRHTKNSKNASMAIPSDLAAALWQHVKGQAKGDKLFWISKGKNRKKKDAKGREYTIFGGPVGMLRRDLAESGLGHVLETDQHVDFHSLRATAITWMLEVDELSSEQTKRRARLSSLAMVEKYIRGARYDSDAWLDNSTLTPTTPDQATKAG